jgi:cysteine-rich repeat protein
MRSTTWLPIGLALFLPAAFLIGGCGPDVDTEPTTGGGGSGGTVTTGGGGSGGVSTGGGGSGGDTGGTGGSTGGTGGAGGFMPPANDACNGQKIEAALDGPPTTVMGTLNGAKDDYTTFCADTTVDPDKVDVVYEIDVPADVTATFTIDTAGFVPVLSLRNEDCTGRLAGDTCLIAPNDMLIRKVALPPGPAWIVVDSGDGQTSDFSLSVEYATPTCGDGVINTGEKCDPADPTNEDGCFNPGTMNQCQFGEPPPDPALVQCPGGDITIGAGDAFQLSLLNNGSGGKNHENVTDAVDCVSPALGPENVFNIKPTASGMLKAQIGNAAEGMLYCDQYPNDCADFILYMRQTTCNSTAPADQLACADFTVNPNSPFGYDELLTINVPVTAGNSYWLFVDGLDDVYGIGGYYLELSLQ